MKEKKSIIQKPVFQYFIIFLTIYSVDVLLNLLTMEYVRKDLFLVGYLIYAAFIFPFAAVLYYLVKTVSQFGPTDNSSFFNFWSLLLPLFQFLPLYYIYLPARFKSMSLVMTLISAIAFSFFWSYFTKEMKPHLRKALFVITQSLFLAAILTGLHMNRIHVRNFLSLKGISLTAGVILITIIIFLLCRKFFKNLSSKKITPRKFDFILFLFLAVFNIAVFFALISWNTGLYSVEAKTLFKDGNNEDTRVILINMSSVRTLNMDMYGYEIETMPRLKKWAEKATLFKRAYSNSSWSLASTASILTGQYPSAHKAQFKYKPAMLKKNEPLTEGMIYSPMDRKLETLAEILITNSYNTAAVSANWTEFGPEFNITKGFKYQYREPNLIPQLLPYRLLYPLRKSHNLLIKIFQPFKNAEIVKQKSLDWINNAEDTNFFLFISFMDAHLPRIPETEYKKMYYDKEKVDAAKYPKQAMNIALYNAQLRYLDDQVCELLENLKDKPWYDNALIIVTSDHGEAVGEWGRYGNGLNLRNHQISIPLIVKFPGQLEGSVIEYPVQSIDIFPTVLEALRIKHENNLPGKNLLIGEERIILAELNPSPLVVEEYGNEFSVLRKAVIIGDKKVLFRNNQPYAVYDIMNDPEERRNIIRESIETVNRARQYMKSLSR